MEDEILTVTIPPKREGDEPGPTYKLKVPTGDDGVKQFFIFMEVDHERENCPREPVFVPKFEEKRDAKGKIIMREGKPEMQQVFTDDNKPVMIPLLDENGMQVERILETPALKKSIDNAMKKWIEEVLPNILIETEFSKIPWHHLYALFTASSSNMSITNDNFRGNDVK